MKLRNKKTGEIYNACRIIFGESIEGLEKNQWKTLEEFNEDWEDYEEPKDFWFIDPEILIACESTDPLLCDKKVAIETMKQIGNYFETEEDAKKAVEKLKAWKRLKDKGFSFGGWEDCNGEINTIYFSIPESKWETDTCDDLDICFGGEE